jgi:hypothetical protein
LCCSDKSVESKILRFFPDFGAQNFPIQLLHSPTMSGLLNDDEFLFRSNSLDAVGFGAQLEMPVNKSDVSSAVGITV